MRGCLCARDITLTPLTSVAPCNPSGASRRRKLLSATMSTFQITAVAFSTFLYLMAAVVLRRTTAKGDSMTFVVRKCFPFDGHLWPPGKDSSEETH